MFNGQKPNFIGIDGGNQRIYVSSYTITNQGTGSESIEIQTQSYSISIPSGDRSDFGAIYGFGSDQIYATNNSSGNIYKVNISGSGYTITDSGNDGAATSNNDGAACHAGDPTVTFDPSLTATQGSCDGANREIDIVLNNSSSSVAATFVVTYTISGSETTLSSGTTVSSSSNGALTVPGQADGTVVNIDWYATNSSYDLEIQLQEHMIQSRSITIDASGCDNPVLVTASTSANTCSGGTATVTITFVGSSGADTQYYDLQYKVDSGSWTNIVDGESITNGETNTHTSVAVSHGSTISFQYRIGDSNPSSGAYRTTGTSSGTLTARAINCADPTFTTSLASGTCSNGSSTPQITVNNTDSATAFFDVQWSTDNSSWTSLQDGASIASGGRLHIHYHLLKLMERRYIFR